MTENFPTVMKSIHWQTPDAQGTPSMINTPSTAEYIRFYSTCKLQVNLLWIPTEDMKYLHMKYEYEIGNIFI